MTLGELSRSAWFPFSDEPVVEKHWHLPRLGSPSVLAPESSPDGKWHLFTRTWLGIQHFVSTNGLFWTPFGRMPVGGVDPCIVSEKGRWYLFTVLERRAVVVQESEDLRTWSKQNTAFEAEKNQVIGHPRLCRLKGRWHLYYTQGENSIGRWRTIPLSLFLSTSLSLGGPYGKGKVVLAADADNPLFNMGLGAFSLLPCSDGLGLITASAYWNRSKMGCESALLLFQSTDGEHFSDPSEILLSPESLLAFLGSESIYRSDERTWYCYYAAMEKDLFHKSSIRLLLGRNPQNPLFPA